MTQPYYGPPPDDNMVWAILSTLFCCLPLGVVSIVKANQVRTLWFAGYPAEARKAADEARKWALWSALSVLVLVVLCFVVALVLTIVGISVWSSS